MNKLKVLLFASLRDAVGARTIELELPPGCSVAELRRQLAAQYPALAPWQANVKVAVDQEYAGEEQTIPDQAEIALIPPVSGG